MNRNVATDTNYLIDYKLLFNNSSELYLLLKPNPPEYTILAASDAYLKATLTKRAKISGKGLFTVFPDNPDDHSADGINNLSKSLEKVISTKETDKMAVQKYDIPLPPEQGKGFEERYWNPRNTPILNEKNEIVYVLHQVEDVTAVVKLEIKRKKEAKTTAEIIRQKSLIIEESESRINMVLEAMLKYTTMDFSKRLRTSDKGDDLDAIIVSLNSLIDELENNITTITSANEALAYANQELDSFSYSVSHDLRAPLRGINGYAQMLIEDYSDKLDEEGKQMIAVIMKNALRMGSLIDDLLTFSRVGKQNISQMPLNMNDIVNSVINDLSSGGEVRATFDLKQLAPAEGDPNMMMQVMSNLISNAIKYSSKKEAPHIEIGSHPENEMMVFYVKDNGAGFDMKYYDKLFGVFQRLHGAAEFEGTGVGLALVQRIIKKHHGEIRAEAKPGEGATFSFYLPIKNTGRNG